MIGVRLPPKQREKIDQLVQEGHYLNLSDFVRKAIDRLLEVKA